jgi:hypothetical protein
MTKTLRLLLLFFLLTACVPTATPSAPTPLASDTPTAAPPTPTFTAPAPTATFIPSERYFQEDFNKDVTDWQTHVTSGEPGLFDLRVEDGNWLFDFGGKKISSFTLYQPEIYKNVRIDVRVVKMDTSPNTLSLICRYTEKDGWYQYEVFNSGAYNLYYSVWDEESKPVATLLADGVADSMLRGDAVNEIGMACADRDLSLYVNGQLARTYTDDQYVLRDGWVGVGVTSFDQIPLLVALDWLKITIP